MTDIFNISILYIEDDDGVRNSIARVLGMTFKKVITASNGLEALEELKNNRFDIVITDIRMPKMDGFEFILKMQEAGYKIPIIITSAFNDAEYLLKAIELQVDKFILKPIKVNKLLDAVSVMSYAIISERELQKKKLELEHYRNAIEQTNLVIAADIHGKITHINEELKGRFNFYSRKKQIPNTLNELLKENEVESLLIHAKELKIFTLLTTVSFNEKLFAVELTSFPSRFEEGTIEEITIILKNVTHIANAKDKIIAELYLDHTTQLFNRAKLFQDLSLNLNFGLVIIDIDKFAHVNYLFGMRAGDDLLKQFASILENCWPKKEQKVTAYRIESDHFALLIEKSDNFILEKGQEKIKKFIKNIEKCTFSVNSQLPIQINFTVGGSYLKSDNLFMEAYIALEYAKKTKQSFVCFSDLDYVAIKDSYNENFHTQSLIQTAVQNKNVTCHYQPICDSDAHVVKYEALMRINLMDEKKSIVYPGQFLEIAQNSKFYPQMSKIVITKAINDFKGSSYGVSVNVSYIDISSGEVVKYLLGLIKKHSDTQITVELLESEGLKDIQKTIDFCYLVKEAGGTIAIDDFGSGYSNFGYFIDMPIDFIKLDGSLVKRIHEYRGYLAVESIVMLAKKLEIKTVAEYVETKEDFEKLKTLGVDLYQGYYFSPAKAFENLNH